jgi:protease IV
MSIIPDLMFERDKLREQIRRWKWLFLVILLILVVFITKDTNVSPNNKEIIARIRIEGVIDHDKDLTKKLKEIGDNPRIKAVLLHVDSPGGVAYAGENLYIELKRLSEKKPVVSVLETLAASAGYMIALGTDYIVARNMTITGSIGVIWQSFEMVEMANKLGINFVSVKSSPLKAAPNPMEKITPDAKAATKQSIDDSYDVFLAMLMEGRSMKKTKALKLANGQVYTGRRAKELGLIDEIGAEEEAVAWLEKNKNISPQATIVDINWSKPTGMFKEISQFFHNSNKMIMQMFGTSSSLMAK